MEAEGCASRWSALLTLDHFCGTVGMEGLFFGEELINKVVYAVILGENIYKLMEIMAFLAFLVKVACLYPLNPQRGLIICDK